MKVAIACPYAWDAPGGVQVHVEDLARHLIRLGHEVLVLTPAWDGVGDDGVRVVGKPVRLPFNGSVAPVCPDPRSRSRIAAMLEDFGPDVLHAHEPFAPSAAMFSVLSSPAPAVGTFHAYARASVAGRAFRPLLKRVWERLSVRLAVSQASASIAARRFGGDVEIVPNGVDVDMFRGAAPAPLPPGPRLLFVNRLEPRKGFVVALQAFRLLSLGLPEALLVVAGDGSERSQVEKLPHQVRERIVMLGTVPHEELPHYYASADAFLAPATGGESFGIVLLEAMAAGVPVVATDIPGYREVARAGTDALLVRPNHPVELASAARRILVDPGLAASLTSAGRARAEEFRWETVARRIEDAYGRALEVNQR